MTVSSNGTPALVASTGTLTPSVTATFPTGASPLAGHLMVLVAGAYSTTTAPVPAAPSGWTLWNWVNGQTASNGAATALQWTAYYVKTATGSDTAPALSATFTGTAANANLAAVLYDLSDSGGSTPVLFTDGIGNLPAAGPVNLFTAGPAPAGALGIVSQVVSQGTTSAVNTWTAPATGSWNACTTNQTASQASQFATFWTAAAPTTGQCMAASVTHSRTSTQSPTAVIIVAPPGSAGVRVFQASAYQAPTNSVATLTTPSFTPQAGELLVASVAFGNGGGIAATSMVMSGTGNGSGTWTQRVRRAATTSGGDASVQCTDVGGSPAASTVTCTVAPSTVLDPAMAVYRVAGAQPAASQNGATASGTTATLAVTPASTGGVIFGADGEDGTTALTPNAATVAYISTTGGAGDRINLFWGLAVTAAGTGQTLGWSTAPTQNAIAAAEIIPAPAPAGGLLPQQERIRVPVSIAVPAVAGSRRQAIYVR